IPNCPHLYGPPRQRLDGDETLHSRGTRGHRFGAGVVGVTSPLHSLTPIVGVNAFHEKVGRSQVGSVFFFIGQGFLPPSCHCRHPSIRTLGERFSLGASWAFSFQPVLPPGCRPPVPFLRM